MRSLNQVRAEKVAAIVAGINRKLVLENAVLPQDAVSSIAEGYFLLLQMVWYRIPNDTKVDSFILTYESLVANALTALKTNKFDDIVSTYRSLYTNLYTAKGGARVYNLNQKSAKEFLDNVLSGNTKVVAHQVQRTVKTKPAPTTSNSFLVSLATKFALVAESKPTQPSKPTEVAEKQGKAKPKVAGFFTEVKDKSVLEPGMFVRIVLSDKSKIFGRWEVIVSPTYQVAVKNKQGQVLAVKEKDVVSISTYTKAIW
jgi:hypothetical protein